MKKHIKITALLFTLAILANITGCGKSESSPGVSDNESSVSANDSTVNGGDSSDSAGVSDNSESTPDSDPESSSSVPDRRLTDEQLKMISELKMQSLVGPDGETLLMTDAVDAVRDEGGGKLYSQEFLKDANGDYILDENGTPIMDETWVDVMLTFDFAYMRYARPYFYAVEHFEDEERETLPEMKWFKVREGDKPDCGLTVKKAQFEMFPVLGWDNLTYLQTIELDGEITLEGMLFATSNPNDYASKVGDLNFIVDPTKTEGIPVIRQDHDNNAEWYNLNRCLYPGVEPEYYESDVANMWYIGNIDDDDFDASAVFGGDEFVRVKATLKNIKLDVFNEIAGGGFGGCNVTADIVDIERID